MRLRHFFLTLSLALLGTQPALASDLSSLFPDQTLAIGYSKATVTRTIQEKASENGPTVTEAIPYSLGSGLAFEYGMFLKSTLTLTFLFELDLGGPTSSVILMGGAAGLSWYILGGKSESYEDATLAASSKSRFNLFVFGGMGGYSYNFKPFETAVTTAGKVQIQSQQRSVTESSTLGLQFGFGAEYPFTSVFLIGFHYNIFNGFESQDKPKVGMNSIWLTASFYL